MELRNFLLDFIFFLPILFSESLAIDSTRLLELCGCVKDVENAQWRKNAEKYSLNTLVLILIQPRNGAFPFSIDDYDGKEKLF